MTKSFAHNVSRPPAIRFHCPPLGGRFAARVVEVAAAEDHSFVAWHGYDPDSFLDEVWCKGPGEQAARLSATPGDHHRPVITAGANGVVDVAWVADQCRLVHATRRGGAWRTADVVAESQHWLRDPAICRDGDTLWLVVIETVGKDDALLIHRLDGAQWTRCAAVNVPGSIWRTASLMTDAGLLIAYDVYDRNRYHIETRTFDGTSLGDAQRVEPCDDLCILPRLTPGPDGRPWVSFLSERFVVRDGVLGRAASARAARFDGKTWRLCGEGYKLYRALLPITRYFGYDGLRRNPRLCATDDGAMHLVFEQQRDETGTWDNLTNGFLTAVKWTGDGWDGPYRWREGSCCYAFDHRHVHRADAVDIFCRCEHREDGLDYVVGRINPAAAPRVDAEDYTPWAGWKPYQPVAPPPRETTTIDGQTYHLFFGDLHNHSLCSSDADGYQDELYHFARDVARIDFAGITDNDYYPDNCFQESESNTQKRICRKVTADGDFVAFAGFEWTFHRPDETFNHRSVIFHDDDGRVVRRIEPAAHTEQAMRKSLANINAFAHAHHGEYVLLDSDAEANVEITSGWAINIEKAPIPHEQLDRGIRFGFIGGSDSHRMTPGLGGALVAVWAKSLNREAIVEALKARRCYATTGNRPVIDFRADGQPMGSVVVCPDAPRFTVRVRTGRPLKRVSVIRGGAVAHEFDVSGNTLDGEWTDGDAPAGGAWYYLRVEDDMPHMEHPHNVAQAVGPLAWSSPIWIERK